ncbi:MAG: N-acetylmuramoyl-L-alanine amidase [Lachnospiraceae bacterium]|nr:N-acetylmuramoyl-L-alanine amidase [Lachnospiraceae bacterium]
MTKRGMTAILLAAACALSGCGAAGRNMENIMQSMENESREAAAESREAAAMVSSANKAESGTASSTGKAESGTASSAGKAESGTASNANKAAANESGAASEAEAADGTNTGQEGRRDVTKQPESEVGTVEEQEAGQLPTLTEEELTVLSGKTVCLDPGHFAGRNALDPDDGTTYCEGDVTLEIGLALRDILEEYGVNVIMTRETGSITLGGYTDAELDGGHISLRGASSAGCDLFVSLHTNANLEQANGYPTCGQPKEINKPIVIVNVPGSQSVEALTAGSEIGENLVSLYQKIELGAEEAFESAEVGDELREWSDAYNDSLEEPGAIVMRTEGGSDYYGVLSGSAGVGVPGMIVEHGFHTVKEFRELINDGDLIDELAEADAEGILAGLLAEE